MSKKVSHTSNQKKKNKMELDDDENEDTIPEIDSSPIIVRNTTEICTT